MKRYGVILGAGMGTRMKSQVPKVLHEVMGKPMIAHAVSALEEVGVEKIVVVTGHKAELVELCLGTRVMYARQETQLGTAHAVKMAEDLLLDLEGTTVITYGDVPLLTTETLEALFDQHEKSGAGMTLLTAIADDPTGYGRIIRSATDDIARIVEQKDANSEQLKIKEINSGVACYNNIALFKALQKVRPNNNQKEYYLTDVVEILAGMGHIIEGLISDDFEETLGVNDRLQLADASRNMQMRINKKHMVNGVTFTDPTTAYIEKDVKIAEDVIIEPNVYLKGNTTVATGAIIGSGSHLDNANIGVGVHVQASYISDSTVGDVSTVGPFAHIRANSHIGHQARIGNFVEVKNATLGDGVKSGHLAYVGDAEIGARTNVSCGVITANYDGKNKFKTIVGSDVMIGSNVNLVAPVEVGDRAYIAAGSTVTKNVPSEALAIARSKQTNKDGYANKF